MDIEIICFAILMFLVNTHGGRSPPEGRCRLTTVFRMLGADCSNINLVNIPNQTKSIEVLDASVNRIRILKNNSFTTYSSLKFLYLNDNSITIIEAGAFIPLEELEVLDLSLNAIRDLPAMMPSTLRRIYISENPLESIPLGAAVALTYVNLSSCRLTELPHIGELPMLVELNISSNPLINLTVNNLASFCHLETLRLPHELLESKYISSCDCVRVKRWTIEHSILVIPNFNCTVFDDEAACINNSTDEARTFAACQMALQQHYASHWTAMACGIGIIIICAVVLTIVWRRRRRPSPQPHRNPEQEAAFRTRKLLEEAPKSKF
ncbi:leucine-rich repeat-containing protein 4C [Halyomorpha halys]|uniref:leucine-rich repeat-containing protein 4C n=1 Tax=Halyomorpha halys TaxID=286706 RepID=UPI0006D4E782